MYQMVPQPYLLSGLHQFLTKVSGCMCEEDCAGNVVCVYVLCVCVCVCVHVLCSAQLLHS